MIYARLVYLWCRAMAWWRRRPPVPSSWEKVTPLEADPDYLELLIALHAADGAWFLRMSRQLPSDRT